MSNNIIYPEAITLREVQDNLRDCETATEVREIFRKSTEGRTLYGTAGDFHNLAVRLSKEKQLYNLACEVLEKGLEMPQYSRDVDLLADYIFYGIKCGKEKQCAYYYSVLCTIPKKRWKWRAFSFSIDYLLQVAERIESNEDLDIAVNDMHELANEYIHNFPLDEGGYIVKADIYDFVNQQDEMEDILVKGLELPRAPKCSLRLADIAFEKGKYSEARKYLKHAKVTGIGTESHISINYVYYLDLMCMICDLTPQEVSPEAVHALYKQYAEAKTIMDGDASTQDLLNILDRQIELFGVRTSYKYDPTIFEDESRAFIDINS